MKKLKNLVVIALLSISLSSLAGGGACDGKIKNRDILTEEQIQMRITHCEGLKPKREAFKATLTEDQKAIKRNKDLSRKEKKSQLAATLSPEQKAMKDEIKEIAKANRAEFKATLTDEQKKQLRERRKSRR